MAGLCRLSALDPGPERVFAAVLVTQADAVGHVVGLAAPVADLAGQCAELIVVVGGVMIGAAFAFLAFAEQRAEDQAGRGGRLAVRREPVGQRQELVIVEPVELAAPLEGPLRDSGLEEKR